MLLSLKGPRFHKKRMRKELQRTNQRTIRRRKKDIETWATDTEGIEVENATAATAVNGAVVMIDAVMMARQIPGKGGDIREGVGALIVESSGMGAGEIVSVAAVGKLAIGIGEGEIAVEVEVRTGDEGTKVGRGAGAGAEIDIAIATHESTG